MHTSPLIGLGLVLAAAPCFAQAVVGSSAGALEITPVASGLDEPWGLAFLPNGSFLVTERGGAIKLFPSAGSEPVLLDGGPSVEVDGQGGLLDILVPADFETSREVWLTYAATGSAGAVTAVGRGVLSADGSRLDGFETVFSIPEGASGGRHFGSRLVEAADGTLFLTVGDRGTGPDGMEAQDPMRGEGKVIHLTRDGQPATTVDGALPGVFSWGHRNPQGAALDLEGRLLTTEHGAQGGDELNAPQVGRNYGWPVITFGENYGGGRIGEGTEKAGMEQPLHYWDPSIAPSGLVVYSGKLIPKWRGDILFGSLNSDFLGRLDPDTPGPTGFAEERISSAETGRVRDVVEAPDGSIWFLSVTNEAAYRIAPAK
ncbi:MAG: PQQ-dependent sugar dehydrogenase [Tabrizicola sp.]|jgi:glucose/arabinose dehydrogenase|nr:PQQ-dependent sugar dehydrogenase [Tabrizicola sp.]